MSVRVTEIFHSLQGEADAVGWPTVFVRLTGCPLRCGYCDTAYAFHGGRAMEQVDILDEFASYSTRHVCVTGGEPLAQATCIPLLTALADAGHAVSIETSGALDLAPVDPRVAIVMDVKTPGSGEHARNRGENLALLKPTDQIKYVLTSREDYDWALAHLREHDLAARCQILFSPAFGEITPQDLAAWILADRAPVRFQLQLHKVLWGNEPGR